MAFDLSRRPGTGLRARGDRRQAQRGRHPPAATPANVTTQTGAAGRPRRSDGLTPCEGGAALFAVCCGRRQRRRQSPRNGDEGEHMARADRPNIVFILTDDQAVWAAGCYGNAEIRTPNLDRIAATGVRFENYFVTVPGVLGKPGHAVDRPDPLPARRARFPQGSARLGVRSAHLPDRRGVLHGRARRARLELRFVRQVAPGLQLAASASVLALVRPPPRRRSLQRPRHDPQRTTVGHVRLRDQRHYRTMHWPTSMRTPPTRTRST